MGWLKWFIHAVVTILWTLCVDWIAGTIILQFFDAVEKDTPTISVNPNYLLYKYSLMVILLVAGLFGYYKLATYLFGHDAF